MIFDRTQNDVDTAIRIRRDSVQNFKTLMYWEIKVLEKGTLTINTLNRIEQKQYELKYLFNDMGYWNTNISNYPWEYWEYTDIFDVVNFQRIIYNLNVLRDAFFVYKDTPNTPPVSYHYNDINALEKILYDLDVMINDVKANYRYCGEFECGE